MSKNSENFVKLSIMKNIKSFRTENKISQQQIADLFGIDRSTYSSWETGRSTPNAAQLILLAKIYNVSVERLISNNADVFSVASKSFFANDGSFLSQLNDDEIDLILKYRMLDEEEKEKIIKEIEK